MPPDPQVGDRAAETDPGTDPVTERTLDVIREALPDAVTASETSGAHPWIRVDVEHLRRVARLVKEHPDLQFDCCHLISGVDWPDANDA